MEGFAVKRLEDGKYWNKSMGWCDNPSIYPQKRFATCAGKYHTSKEIKTVKVRIIVEEE